MLASEQDVKGWWDVGGGARLEKAKFHISWKWFWLGHEPSWMYWGSGHMYNCINFNQVKTKVCATKTFPSDCWWLMMEVCALGGGGWGCIPPLPSAHITYARYGHKLMRNWKIELYFLPMWYGDMIIVIEWHFDRPAKGRNIFYEWIMTLLSYTGLEI